MKKVYWNKRGNTMAHYSLVDIYRPCSFKMVTFDKDPCLTEVTKVTALSLSVTFLGHSLQGNIGSPLLMLLMLLEFILVSLKLKKNKKKKILIN